MKISTVKSVLKQIDVLQFQLPDGRLVPSHFHITEVGCVKKHFIDCGGTIRNEEVVNFQLWNANDYDHRLHPEKLLAIIELSEKALSIKDVEVEVEYQTETIAKFGLEFDGANFLLTVKHTDCLAKDNCSVPEKETSSNATCSPESGCC